MMTLKDRNFRYDRREGHIQVFYAFDSTKSWGYHRHGVKTQTFANVFRHHSSSPDKNDLIVVIKNFRGTSVYECSTNEIQGKTIFVK